MNVDIDNTKLAGILRSLDKGGRLSGKRFLESPYFNSSKELLKLFLEIHKLIDKDKPLDKEILWRKISTDKTYNDVRFRKYCSDLSKLMEQFLAQKEFEKDPVQKHIFLLRGIKDVESQKVINSTLREANELSEKAEFKDGDYYLNQYLIQRSFYEIFDFETRRSDKANLDEISKYLDFLYFSEKLRISCEVIQRQNFKAYDYNLSFTPTLQEYLKNNNLVEQSPIIALYYQIHKMWSDFDDEEHYFKLKSLIAEHAHLFTPQKAVEDLYTTAQNYCVKRLNQGEGKYLSELFVLFKMLINNNLLVINKELNPWYFRNIIVVGLRLGEYNWTEEFIEQYKNYLPAGLKDNAVTYNLAQLYFYQKRYSEVIRQLQSVEYDDLSYNLNSKAMLLATYYELDEIDLLDSHLETFNTFLKRRTDFPDERKKPYKTLIKFTKKLSRIIPKDKTAMNKLREDIIADGNVANANWLLEKIVALEH
ncbi:MAG: hypothetical protein DA408_05470 [Bacteroidetes bacterium]|nr:MAG: hypothetical protein C7N36_02345 [Bacteroidota bacterium]PTM13746.1 MAG: hypothetical protein DA408_05470 [Bacteroidota bacterium]